MKLAIAYGLGESVTGDGNGLKKIADYFRAKGHDVKIYSAYDTVKDPFDMGFGHSYGCAVLIQYARDHLTSTIIQLTLIEPVVKGWWFFGLPAIGQWKIPMNVMNVISYYTNSFPVSSKIKSARKFTNIPMLQYGHTSIVEPAVADIMKGI